VGRLQAQHGFAGFAQGAAPQLIRWESPYGWTRSGWGRVSQQETQLASVLARMLPAPDAWVGFTDRYLTALDQAARDDSVRRNRVWQSTGRDRERRTEALAEWHRLLLDRLIGSEAEDRLDRLTRTPRSAGRSLSSSRPSWHTGAAMSAAPAAWCTRPCGTCPATRTSSTS
jgi:hypothetical protein